MANRVFTDEFKAEAVKLVVEGGCSAKQAAERLGINHGTLLYWVKIHRRNARRSGANQEQSLRERVRELERQLERVTVERDILKKAAVFFAKEQP
jgi:transposase